MGEVWKDIEGYENLYQVSNLGRVKSLVGFNGHIYVNRVKVLKQSNTTTGYKKVELTINKRRKSHKVHRLVAFAFIPNPNHKPNINHKDGNPINNKVENLEWCTQRENVQHAVDTGLKGVYSFDKAELEELYSKYGTKKIGELYGVSFTPILKAINDYGITKRKSGAQNKYNITEEYLLNELKVKTQTELAKEIGCTQSLLSHYVKRINIGGKIR